MERYALPPNDFIGHSGKTSNFNTQMYYQPSTGSVQITLINTDTVAGFGPLYFATIAQSAFLARSQVTDPTTASASSAASVRQQPQRARHPGSFWHFDDNRVGELTRVQVLFGPIRPKRPNAEWSLLVDEHRADAGIQIVRPRGRERQSRAEWRRERPSSSPLMVRVQLESPGKKSAVGNFRDMVAHLRSREQTGQPSGSGARETVQSPDRVA